MKAESRVKICVCCDRPIEGAALPVGRAVAQAASGDEAQGLWRHVKGDPACRPLPLCKRRARGSGRE